MTGTRRDDLAGLGVPAITCPSTGRSVRVTGSRPAHRQCASLWPRPRCAAMRSAWPRFEQFQRLSRRVGGAATLAAFAEASKSD
jgi:hypothetical protein